MWPFRGIQRTNQSSSKLDRSPPCNLNIEHSRLSLDVHALEFAEREHLLQLVENRSRELNRRANREFLRGRYFD